MTPDVPSDEELLAGRMADGSRPKLPSGKLCAPPGPIPGAVETLPQHEVERLRAHYKVDLQHFEEIDLVCQFSHALVQAAHNAITAPRPAATTRPVREDGDDVDAAAAQSRPGRPPYSMGAGSSGERAERTPTPAPTDDDVRAALDGEMRGILDLVVGDADSVDDNPALSRGADLGGGTDRRVARVVAAFADLPIDRQIMVGERGAKLLLTASAKRAELAHKLVDRATELDTRKSFLQNRAVGVVFATMLHMDESFKDVGFGSWMPFRFPDQWLSFCGIMRRVLAANGLIHSEHAEVYRKLLTETPEPEGEGDAQQRAKQAQTPENLGIAFENRGASTMEALKTRLGGEVWGHSKPPPRKQYGR